MTPVFRTYQDKDSDRRKFPQIIVLAGDSGSGDLEWLTKGLLDRCPVLYSLGKEILEQIRSAFPPGELRESGRDALIRVQKPGRQLLDGNGSALRNIRGFAQPCAGGACS